MLRFCFPAVLAALLLSCLSEPDCVVTSSSEVKISLKKTTSDSARFVLFDKIEVDGTDSVFYSADSVSSLVLPIHTGQFETTYRFYYESKTDSIKISYTRYTNVISPSCGSFNHFKDLAVVWYSFSSVVVVNPQITTSGSANLDIKL